MYREGALVPFLMDDYFGAASLHQNADVAWQLAAIDFQSFGVAGLVAGLVCVHHQHLPLFGGGFADLAPCLIMIGVSAATGVLRLVYDEHWASDVMVGWADGILSGYVLPSLMHFGFGSGRPVGEIQSGSLDAIPTLIPVQGGTELGMLGVS
jgi:hypothetical protein